MSPSFNEICSKSKIKGDRQVGSLISWRLDKYGWFNASSTSCNIKNVMHLISKMDEKNEIVICRVRAYQLCVCTDRTLAFSQQDQVLQLTNLETFVQKVAWGSVEAAWHISEHYHFEGIQDPNRLVNLTTIGQVNLQLVNQVPFPIYYIDFNQQKKMLNLLISTSVMSPNCWT